MRRSAFESKPVHRCYSRLSQVGRTAEPFQIQSAVPNWFRRRTSHELNLANSIRLMKYGIWNRPKGQFRGPPHPHPPPTPPLIPDFSLAQQKHSVWTGPNIYFKLHLQMLSLRVYVCGGQTAGDGPTQGNMTFSWVPESNFPLSRYLLNVKFPPTSCQNICPHSLSNIKIVVGLDDSFPGSLMWNFQNPYPGESSLSQFPVGMTSLGLNVHL